MKHFIWICAALVVLSACSKQEETAAPEVTPDAVEETTGDTAAAAAAEESSAALTEEIEVVEESAAEPESTEQEIKLAVAEPPAAAREWQFKEGEHYFRMVPTQPTVGGADKIEVAEFFWYGCPHCYDLEPYINKWAEDKDPNVRFVRVPATWNALVRLHGQL